MILSNQTFDMHAWFHPLLERLNTAGISNAQQELFWMFNELGIKPPYDQPQPKAVDSLDQWIKRREKGEPLAYLFGHWSFMGFELKVNQNVLIPRAETETMVEAILAKQPDNTALDVLELGTGPGSISIALAKHRPLWKITASDNSPAALHIARQNITKQQVLTQIQLIHSHWFEQITDTFDLIISNPPYLSEEEYQQNTDLIWEPKSALVSHSNGLSDFEVLIKGAKKHLKPSGTCYFEHGHQQFEPIKTMAIDQFQTITSGKDLSQKQRFIILSKAIL